MAPISSTLNSIVAVLPSVLAETSVFPRLTRTHLPRRGEARDADEDEILVASEQRVGVDRIDVDDVALCPAEVDDPVAQRGRAGALGGEGVGEAVGARSAAQHVRASAAAQDVIEGAAIQHVVAALTGQNVDAAAPVQDIGAAIAGQPVVGVAAGDPFDAGGDIAGRVAEREFAGREIHPDRGGSQVVDHVARPGPAIDLVGAGARAQHVVAIASVQRVGIVAAHQQVVGRTAFEQVGADIAEQPFATLSAQQRVVARAAEHLPAERAGAEDAALRAVVAVVAALQGDVAGHGAGIGHEVLAIAAGHRAPHGDARGGADMAGVDQFAVCRAGGDEGHAGIALDGTAVDHAGVGAGELDAGVDRIRAAEDAAGVHHDRPARAARQAQPQPVIARGDRAGIGDADVGEGAGDAGTQGVDAAGIDDGGAAGELDAVAARQGAVILDAPARLRLDRRGIAVDPPGGADIDQRGGPRQAADAVGGIRPGAEQPAIDEEADAAAVRRQHCVGRGGDEQAGAALDEGVVGRERAVRPRLLEKIADDVGDHAPVLPVCRPAGHRGTEA